MSKARNPKSFNRVLTPLREAGRYRLSPGNQNQSHLLERNALWHTFTKAQVEAAHLSRTSAPSEIHRLTRVTDSHVKWRQWEQTAAWQQGERQTCTSIHSISLAFTWTVWAEWWWPVSQQLPLPQTKSVTAAANLNTNKPRQVHSDRQRIANVTTCDTHLYI